MVDLTLHAKTPTNLQRRRVLQGAAAVIVASAAPVVSAGISSNMAVPKLTPELTPELSGELVCDITKPVKTLILRNHSDTTMVIDRLSKSALMFDGSIVDCNNAFIDQFVAIPANQEVKLQFSKRHPNALVHGVEDYQRVQTRVTRLSDGTRVIPFTAVLQGNGATFV